MILSSDYEPCDFGFSTFQEVWEKSFIEHDSADLLVGYISNESLNYLDQMVDIHSSTNLRLLVGMAMFDGVTSGQKKQLLALDQKLHDDRRGGVYISQQFPFHGKQHVFSNTGQPVLAIIGSSNLSNIVPQTGLERGNFELDFAINTQQEVEKLQQLANSIFADAASPLLDCEDALPIIKSASSALRNHAGAIAIDDSTLQDVKANLGSPTFVLPVKTEEKSSLNVYFGKGRQNGAFIRPRNWYEAALIVDKKIIDSAPGYPGGYSFIVYTDDGFRFGMRTGGGNNKNLESLKDLTTFGRWIKGRLEDSEALQTGTSVNDQTLSIYGRKDLRLTKTSLRELYRETGEVLEVWYLDFSRPQGM